MFGVNAIGALLASLGAASLAKSNRLPFLLTASGILLGLSISLTGVMPTFALAVLVMGVVGFAASSFHTRSTIFWARTSPNNGTTSELDFPSSCLSLTGLSALPNG